MTFSLYETLSVSMDDDGVATLTLDRPGQLNAFDLTMARELERFFLTDARSDDVRAVVVTGAGRAFCAGMDLSRDGNVFGLDESLAPTPEELRAHYDEPPYHDGLRDTGGRVTLAIHALPKPVIAAINGAAVGIGATMTLAMDIRMASTEARIGFVFGRIGITPGGGVVVVPAADRRAAAGARVGLRRRHPHRRGRAGRTAGALGPPARGAAAGRPGAGPVVRPRPLTRRLGLAKQLLYRHAGSAEPLEAHLSDSLGDLLELARGRQGGRGGVPREAAGAFTGKASELPRID